MSLPRPGRRCRKRAPHPQPRTHSPCPTGPSHATSLETPLVLLAEDRNLPSCWPLTLGWQGRGRRATRLTRPTAGPFLVCSGAPRSQGVGLARSLSNLTLALGSPTSPEGCLLLPLPALLPGFRGPSRSPACSQEAQQPERLPAAAGGFSHLRKQAHGYLIPSCAPLQP